MNNKKLLELFRESGEPNFIKFLEQLEKDGVIYAEHFFNEKKRQDKWWKEALERNNEVGKPKKEE